MRNSLLNRKKIPIEVKERKGKRKLQFSMSVQDKPKPKFGKFKMVRHARSPFALVMTDKH